MSLQHILHHGNRFNFGKHLLQRNGFARIWRGNDGQYGKMNRSMCSKVDIPRGKDRKPLNLKEGQELHGYKVLKITSIPERNLMSYRLQHLKSGAEHLHVDSADTNNAFCVTFKTVPKDSTGVAHILEHTTLCGSEKYPVRDPFFHMLDRSLNTYMNAWTGPDFTSYPFTTQNLIDFENLLSVYLDAVFFPKLLEADFRQEGHRLEFETYNDPKTPLQIKGVVYNEMKGVMSQPASYFSEKLTRSLYPDTTYGHNSGGEPSDIPDLSYEQLKEFHRIHYHPSNSRFLTYGDLPLEEHLKKINEVLSRFDRLNLTVEVPDQSLFSSPRRFHFYCPPTPFTPDPSKDTKVSVCAMMGQVTDLFESFSLSILSSLLLNGPNAPMYKSLIDSNIGNNYAPSTGYENYFKQGFFGIGLQGIKKEDSSKVEKLIQETLEDVAKNGFEERRIEALLHQIELSQKHVTTNFGLQLASGLTHSWIHNADPSEALFVNKYIEMLRGELKKGPFFQNLVKKYLLDNSHKVTVVVDPDPEFVKKQNQEELDKINKIASKLSEGDKERIIQKAEELKERQDEKEDLTCLPTLKLDDIPRKPQKHEVEIRTIENIPVTWSAQPTNGIVYFKALSPIPSLPDDLVPLYPLFSSIFTEMGTKKTDYRELAQLIELYTGGIGLEGQLVESPTDLYQLDGCSGVTGLCFSRNVEHMFSLLQEVLVSPFFENPELLRTLLLQKASGMQESLSESGHSFARTYASSGFRTSSHLTEMWSGISQVSYLFGLMEHDIDDVIEKLQRIAKLVLENAFGRIFISAQESDFSLIERKLKEFLQSLPKNKPAETIGNHPIETKKIKSFFALPGSVNYVAQCIHTVPYTHEDSPALQILCKILSSKYLHKEIREKGGAYGGGAGLSGGILSFYSYRDPNVDRTLQTYASSLDWLHKKDSFDEQNLNEAKLRIFAQLDSPVPISRKGAIEFNTGVTYDMRLRRRERIFDLTKQDIINVAEKYLSKESLDNSSIAVVGCENEKIQNDESWQYHNL